MDSERYCGTCDPLCPVDVDDLIAWISAIPFDEWPQQHKVDHQLRPAMVTDKDWHGFYARTDALVSEIMGLCQSGTTAIQRMLSVVMPGHDIPAHRDEQGPSWLCRVHVPLLSNPASEFVIGGTTHLMQVGTAYLVNTMAEHSVCNRASTPRVHFMFDVRR